MDRQICQILWNTIPHLPKRQRDMFHAVDTHLRTHVTANCYIQLTFPRRQKAGAKITQKLILLWKNNERSRCLCETNTSHSEGILINRSFQWNWLNNTVTHILVYIEREHKSHYTHQCERISKGTQLCRPSRTKIFLEHLCLKLIIHVLVCTDQTTSESYTPVQNFSTWYRGRGTFMP